MNQQEQKEFDVAWAKRLGYYVKPGDSSDSLIDMSNYWGFVYVTIFQPDGAPLHSAWYRNVDLDYCLNHMWDINKLPNWAETLDQAVAFAREHPDYLMTLLERVSEKQR